MILLMRKVREDQVREDLHIPNQQRGFSLQNQTAEVQRPKVIRDPDKWVLIRKKEEPQMTRDRLILGDLTILAVLLRKPLQSSRNAIGTIKIPREGMILTPCRDTKVHTTPTPRGLARTPLNIHIIIMAPTPCTRPLKLSDREGATILLRATGTHHTPTEAHNTREASLSEMTMGGAKTERGVEGERRSGRRT